MKYRILIVCEDSVERNRYADALVSLPTTESITYQIATVGSVAAAQLQATRQRFHLIIVALSQQDDGLTLSSRLKDLFPEIRLLLVCEQGVTKSQLHTARLLRANIVESTIDNQSLRAIVTDILGTRTSEHQIQVESNICPIPSPSTSKTTDPAILMRDAIQPFFDPFLEDIRLQTRATVAVVIDKMGRIIGQNGEDKSINIPAVTLIIAMSTTESLKLRKMLGDSNSFHLSLHEGNTFDIYAANIGEERFLALFFNKHAHTPKPGLVWLVMKRSVEKLNRLK